MPDSPHDVFSLVTPADIRRIRDGAQENFVKIIDKVFDRLLVLKGARDLTKNQANTKQLLNCVRVLTRLLPFVFESGPDGSNLEEIVLWTPRPRPGSGADYVLGKQLVSAVVDLLFTSGFTVPAATVGEDAIVRYTIWENGIGQTSSLGSSKEHVSNRVEVLRLLLVLCSKAMYSPPAGSSSLPNRALNTIAYNSNKRMVLCLLCSLINTSLKDRAQGWSIPYRNSAAIDPHDELMLHAMHALFILLEYQVPATKPENKSTADEPDSTPDTDADTNTPSMLLVTETKVGAHNLFRAFIAKLHRTQEFDYLINNILRLLDGTMRANLSILASVTKQPTRTVMPQEATVLLWMLLENNSPFRDYIVDHNSSLKLFSMLLYFMLYGYGDPAQAGLVRTISNILHYLSEDSRFATRLMQPFDQSMLPSTMRIIDASLTHADFMINTVFTLLSSSKPYLLPVYSSLLLLVRNVSPYLTQTSQPTADKLVSLFDIISSPAFIISEPYHIRWLIYLIEVFDYVIHYRAVDNPRLIYRMIKARSCFKRLKAFNLESAKNELAALRDKKSKTESTRTIGKSSTSLKSSYSVSNDDTAGTPPGTPAPKQDADIVSLTPGRGGVDNIERTGSPALSDKARGKRPQLGSQTTTHDLAESRDSGDSNSTSHDLPIKRATGKKSAGAKAPTNQFQPSEEWVFSWLPDLPLDPIISVLDALSEHINKIAETVERDASAAAAAATETADGEHSETTASDSKNLDSHQQQQLDATAPKAGNADDMLSPYTGSVDPTQAIIHWLSSDAMIEALPDLEESMPEIRPRLQGMSSALIVWFRSLLWSMVYASGMKPLGIWKNTRVRLFVVKNSQ
ncbi:hypothetical protein IW140_004027 [Coemansia sp. RSA 1813]|nr:hypothetical protein EV178_003093 [Coemansia sp. RSA 1646]KAJ1770351.1 hypothetical protein LPJ74_003230 [Coemansia sp. RSA 1843]KAJ2214926.1 hypothetical protein EV179_002601 [Coemansia sp. RSA 487]KAJ2568209.1 hypothetical protein IW140_004027 [Coemansia sp. RSA 1813]